MKKSNKILLYGLLISILYIITCVYTHINKPKSITTTKKEVPKLSIKSVDTNSKKNKNNIKNDINDTKHQSTLEYKIKDGKVTIAGNMAILDDEDALKISMMKFCKRGNCDRTILFSADKKMPSWKNLAKEIIDIFYEENITSALFSADKYGNITISGELLTQKSKDKITQIIKQNGIHNLKNNTHLAVLKLKDETIPKNNNTKNSIAIENNITIEKRITIEDNNSDVFDIAQNQITELLATQKITFYRNHARIKNSGIKVLNKIIKIIKDIPNVKIEVRGYTDAGGKRSINKWISFQRAKSVKNYLSNHGINSKDIEAKGLGEDDLLDENAPYSPLNRRVEIEIKRK